MLNGTNKQNNLEILSMWILPTVTTLMQYKINASQLTMIFVCRSKCIFFAQSLTHSGRHWYPISHSFPLVHKNDTFTMFKLHKLLIC